MKETKDAVSAAIEAVLTPEVLIDAIRAYHTVSALQPVYAHADALNAMAAVLLDAFRRATGEDAPPTRTCGTWEPLPYERLNEKELIAAIVLKEGERLLILRPFGWHLDGKHLPNQAEHFSRESVCRELRLVVVDDYGPYIAIVKSAEPLTPAPHGGTPADPKE